jgi:hypothetical protein
VCILEYSISQTTLTRKMYRIKEALPITSHFKTILSMQLCYSSCLELSSARCAVFGDRTCRSAFGVRDFAKRPAIMTR